jgi:hypothetical protein
MRLLWLLIAVLLLTYAAVYKIQTIGTMIPNRIGPESVNLSIPYQMTDSNTLKKAWASNSGSTLFFYIYPEIIDRTSNVGNEYATAIKIGSKQSLKILTSVDAGRSELLAPAYLEVYVNGQTEPETVEIDNLQLQRWSCIVIIKQGRKFSIYINGKLTNAYMCSNMPDFDDSQTLIVGDQRLSGKIALMCLDPYVLSPSDIAKYTFDTMDGEGKPHLTSDKYAFTIPDLNLSFLLCPGGNCSLPKRLGHFEQWNSNYE